jgi:hypothetical protein
MAGLYSFRKGWERENLARYILSRIAFIAHPATVSDDLGSDFFCTLFEIQKEDAHKYLIPRSSFAIQIKSDKNPFNASKQIPYLRELEIPYFVGVVCEDTLSLQIYSGEVLHRMFSYVGAIDELTIAPNDNPIKASFDPPDPRNRVYKVFFPKICELKAEMAASELMNATAEINACCRLILGNISTRNNKENIYHDRDGQVHIVAGSGSAKVFRANLCKRLSECFFNLIWLHENGQTDLYDEFLAYDGLYKSIRELAKGYQPLPEYLTISHDEATILLEKKDSC